VAFHETAALRADRRAQGRGLNNRSGSRAERQLAHSGRVLGTLIDDMSLQTLASEDFPIPRLVALNADRRTNLHSFESPAVRTEVSRIPQFYVFRSSFRSQFVRLRATHTFYLMTVRQVRRRIMAGSSSAGKERVTVGPQIR
jgi:hypothetical protein